MESDKDHFTPGALSVRLLRFYLLYRLLLALLLCAAFGVGLAPDILGSSGRQLFFFTSSFYLLVTLVDFYRCRRQHYHPTAAHLLFILLADITAHTLLMNASGGLGSGIGYLMLVTVAAGSIFFTGQLAILVAAVASIGIIIESTSNLFTTPAHDTLFPAGILGILLFVTALLFQGLNRALRRAEQVASQESEQSAQLQELNEMIISHMLTGILVVDGQGNIELINRAAVQLLGGHDRTARFKRGDNLGREPGLAGQLHHWQQSPRHRPPPFIPQHGNTEIKASFKTLEQSGHKRTLVFLEDFRAATQQAQQLKLASLGRLTASIAHEIRNPLGAISHASQLLEELRDGNPANARLTSIIGKQVRRVNQIVENVLQLSRQHRHAFEPIELTSWLRQFVTDYADTCTQRPLIELRCEAETIATAFDPSHLQQVLGNLLDNAIRHSLQHSGSRWAALHAAVGGIDNLPVLDVLDRGAGVADGDRGKLFEPFFTTSGEGSGLGLYIARELCEINYATLKYQPPTATEGGVFRIGFAHPGKTLERNENE